MAAPLHIPVLRRGQPYRSLDVVELGGATVGQANAGLIRRDAKQAGDARRALEQQSTAELLGRLRHAADLLQNEALPIGDGDATLGPEEFIRHLSSTTGLPQSLCRRNLERIAGVMTNAETILRGLTRALPFGVLDRGLGTQDGVAVSYVRATDSLGVILPSNSPGVNALWLPAIALKVPVVLKPGKNDPWTPNRIAHALFEAGVPREAVSVYPTDHAGTDAILDTCGRAMLFGDAATIGKYAGNPRIELHGPGFSKVMIGADRIARWRDDLGVLVESIASNGGRSCVNASTIVVPARADELAKTLAEQLNLIIPRSADDPAAGLAAFADPAVAERIDAAIELGLKTPGARDVTRELRGTPRLAVLDGRTYLRPTLLRCESLEHPLAKREFLFPFASLVEHEPLDVAALGPSLVVTALTDDAKLIEALLRAPNVGRLNLGPIATSRIAWDQPHEGNLFEFLMTRRAIQRAPLPHPAGHSPDGGR